jgi:ferredoxin
LIWIKDSLSALLYAGVRMAGCAIPYTVEIRKFEMSEWLPRINPNSCTGCGECIAVCPVRALGQVGGKADLVNPAACTYCTLCEDICPVDAIALPFLICKAEAFNSHS